MTGGISRTGISGSQSLLAGLLSSLWPTSGRQPRRYDTRETESKQMTRDPPCFTRGRYVGRNVEMQLLLLLQLRILLMSLSSSFPLKTGLLEACLF